MRKIIQVLLFCVFIIAFSCKKDPIDYRTKYMGNYKFFVHEVFRSFNYVKDTTYYVDAKIDYAYDKETIGISWVSYQSGQDIGFVAQFFEDASFSGQSITGDFLSKTNVVFTGIQQGLPYRVTYDVTGDKIK